MPSILTTTDLLAHVTTNHWASVKQLERHEALMRSLLADTKLEDKPLSELSQADLSRMKSTLRIGRRPGPGYGQPIKASSWATHLGVLRNWVKIGQSLGVLAPGLKITAPPRKNNRFTTISRAEEQRIYDQLDAAADPRAYKRSREEVKQEFYRVGFGIMFMLETGCRVSELLALKAEDLVERDGSFGVVFKNTKSGKDRLVPLNTRAMGAFNCCKPFGLWSMNKGTKAKDYQAFTWYWTRIHSVCCFPNEVVLHSLRHTFATRFIEAGGSPVALKDLLGHSTLEQTMVYVHQSEAALFREVKRLDKNALVV